MLLPPNCITGDIFSQLRNDYIISTIKQKMKVKSMWRMKNETLINEFSAPILSRTMKWNIILRQTTSSINSDLSMSY